MKTIFIFLLLFGTFTTKAQIKFQSDINLGWTDWSNSIYANDQQYTMKSTPDKLSLFSDLNFKAKWKGFEVKTNILTLMDKGTSYTFKPRLSEYKLGLYYNWKFINVGAEHSCTHPVLSKIEDIKEPLFRASYNKVYIGITIGNYQKD